jgi:hypothetical protein
MQKIVVFRNVPDLDLSNSKYIEVTDTDWQAKSAKNVGYIIRPIKSDVTQWQSWFKYGTIL